MASVVPPDVRDEALTGSEQAIVGAFAYADTNHKINVAVKHRAIADRAS
jgi:hypothetical protein